MTTPTYKGPTHPVIRDGNNDFRMADGLELLQANVAEVLGTPEGTLPWRPTFGSKLHRLLHAPAASIQFVAQYFVVQALERWLPYVKLKAFSASFAEGKLKLQIAYRVVRNGQTGPIVTGQQIIIQ